MKVTIKDVAKLANVSTGTVSLAFNDKKGVNAKTKQKVFDAVKKLNYRPNHFARGLIINKSSSIGLVITDITNPYFGMIIKNVQKEAENKGYNLLLGISGDRSAVERKFIEDFLDRNVEGLIVVPAHEKESDLSHLYNLRSMGIPFVFASTAYRGIQADCVMTDLSRGSYLLTKHLIEKGHRKIFFITGYKELLLSSMRVDGYKSAYKESGLDYKDDWIIESYPDFSNGYEVTKSIIKECTPDAIITVNDLVAMGALKCLLDNGLKVPDDVSVAGYDDLLFSSILETPLTTIRQPVEEIARISVGLLLELIEGKASEGKSIKLEPELVIRNSTRN